MSAIRNWTRGRDTSFFTLEPCTVAATGILTVVTGKSLLGRFEDVRIQYRTVTDMIMSVDDVIANNVVLYDDYTVTITEKKASKTGSVGGGYEPILPGFFFNATRYDYFKLTLAAGGKQYVIYLVRGELTDGVAGPGGQSITASFSCANVNIDASSTASLLYGDAS